MKYTNRVVTTIAFEGEAIARYKREALRLGIDFNAWVVAQCERTCKADNRKISNRNNKGE